MATVKDLGLKVQAKYPGQYDDLSPEEVGRKVKGKFPGQYDDFEDEPARVGMGDVQAAPSAWTGSSNVPVGLLTGDEATDNQIGQNLAAHGARRAITKTDVGRVAAGLGSVALPFAIPSVALGGAVGGGLASLASTDADNPMGAARDTLVGALTGGTSAKALQYVSKIAAPVAQWLADKSTDLGRKALSGIGTSLSARREIPAAAVEQAYKSGAIQPFSTVKGIANRLESTAEEIGGRYGAILKDLEAQGVTGPNAQVLAQKLATEADASAANTLGSSTPGFLRDRATELTGATIPQHHGPPIVIPPKVTANAAGDLGLMQSEQMKRQLQQEARREYDKISRQYTTAGQNKVELASTMRGAIEDAIDAQSAKAPETAARFMPVKEELSNTLEALKAASEGARRASRRKAIGLTDTIVGSAAAASAGNPLAGIPAALLHGLMDRRLASTGGSLARAGATGLQSLAGSEVPVAAETATQISPELQAWLLRRLGGPSLTPAIAEDQR